ILTVEPQRGQRASRKFFFRRGSERGHLVRSTRTNEGGSATWLLPIAEFSLHAHSDSSTEGLRQAQAGGTPAVRGRGHLVRFATARKGCLHFAPPGKRREKSPHAFR